MKHMTIGHVQNTQPGSLEWKSSRYGEAAIPGDPPAVVGDRKK